MWQKPTSKIYAFKRTKIKIQNFKGSCASCNQTKEPCIKSMYFTYRLPFNF